MRFCLINHADEMSRDSRSNSAFRSFFWSPVHTIFAKLCVLAISWYVSHSLAYQDKLTYKEIKKDTLLN